MRPVLFSIGPFPIFAFGFMISLGLVLSLALMARLSRKNNFPAQNDAADLLFVVAFSGFLGARLLYILQNFSWYTANPAQMFALWEGGLVFYGGMVGSFIAGLIFMKVRRIPICRGLDFMAPFIALTHAFGRIGCFLNGCCYGKICDLPWAVKFPELDLPVHPTQLYEAAFDLVLFFLLYRRYQRPHANGQIFALYVMAYAIGRFLIEFLRADNPMVAFLTYNQWISVVSFLVAAFFWNRCHFEPKARNLSDSNKSNP